MYAWLIKGEICTLYNYVKHSTFIASYDNGINLDMTSQTYTFYIGPYEGFALEAPQDQIFHMNPYKMRIICEVISTSLNIQSFRT